MNKNFRTCSSVLFLAVSLFVFSPLALQGEDGGSEKGAPVRIPSAPAFPAPFFSETALLGSVRSEPMASDVLYAASVSSASVRSDVDSVEYRIAELNRLFSWIYACGEDMRWNASDSFLLAAKAVMEADPAADFPFERVRNLNYFKADDGSFRMLNWGIPDVSGTVSYKALLQVRRQTKKDYVLYDLSDMSLYQPYPEQMELGPESWWGAFYYQCIEHKVGGRTYYTFLGWNAGQSLYQQSVIEVMSIRPNGEVVFGASIFSNKGRIPGSDRVDKSLRDADVKRVVFRFSKQGGMILRYDYQTYVVRNDRGRKVEKKDNMVIFDKLVPQQASMADDYAYYIPQGGRYQAYVFLNNKWRLQEEVIARNPEPKRQPRKPVPRRLRF